jgi:hypothetical protein
VLPPIKHSSSNLTATIEILLHYNLEMGMVACKRLVILMSASRFSSNAQPDWRDSTFRQHHNPHADSTAC